MQGLAKLQYIAMHRQLQNEKLGRKKKKAYLDREVHPQIEVVLLDVRFERRHRVDAGAHVREHALELGRELVATLRLELAQHEVLHFVGGDAAREQPLAQVLLVKAFKQVLVVEVPACVAVCYKIAKSRSRKSYPKRIMQNQQRNITK